MSLAVPSLKIATVIGSDKGGVGKSLVSSLLVEAYDKARRPLAVVEIDHQRKLRSLMGDRVDLSLPASAELAAISKNRHHAERFYNPIYDQWRRCDSLTDLGANVTTNVLDWMKICYIPDLAKEDGIHFRFVSVTSPDDQALKSAASAVHQALTVMGPATEIFLVLNEPSSGSGYEHYERHQAFAELAVLQKQGLRLLHIPFCGSELMDYGRARSLSPLSIFHRASELAAEMQMSRIIAHAEQRKMLEWMEMVQEQLAPLFAAPPRQPRHEPGHPGQRTAEVRPLHQAARPERVAS